MQTEMEEMLPPKLTNNQKCSKLSDHLVICHNTLTNRQLTVTRLSANCLDGWLMKGIVRCEEFRLQELHALAESRQQEYGVTTLTYWSDV